MPGFYDGKVRDRSPETSWDAAGRQTDDKTSQVAATIRVLLGARGPLTHEQLVDEYDRYVEGRPWLRRVTPQNVRTRTAAMHHAGTIRPTGERRPTRAGSFATVWELVPIGDANEATA
ncbi:hypothetical protein DEI81_07965 [Curtobacterium sp. MCBD17_013]|uniref:hypothetical protein n=1 Tax=Curtobacterium sp. MCBD17_013 TaxID=2175668 RepID=UPI000DA9A758|nr:hypothetical protein [Curtobacterium sp. MCBD17_013]PZF63333.1 hypothetical protein DEI81_07965 [Curtobacterium sp. MCBD17_013]